MEEEKKNRSLLCDQYKRFRFLCSLKVGVHSAFGLGRVARNIKKNAQCNTTVTVVTVHRGQHNSTAECITFFYTFIQTCLLC